MYNCSLLDFFSYIGSANTFKFGLKIMKDKFVLHVTLGLRLSLLWRVDIVCEIVTLFGNSFECIKRETFVCFRMTTIGTESCNLLVVLTDVVFWNIEVDS